MRIKILPLDQPLKNMDNAIITASEMQKTLDSYKKSGHTVFRGCFDFASALDGLEYGYNPTVSHAVSNLRIKTYNRIKVEFTAKFPWIRLGRCTKKILDGDLVPLPSPSGYGLYNYIANKHKVVPMLRGIGTLTSDNTLKDITIYSIDLVIDGNESKDCFVSRWGK